MSEAPVRVSGTVDIQTCEACGTTFRPKPTSRHKKGTKWACSKVCGGRLVRNRVFPHPRLPLPTMVDLGPGWADIVKPRQQGPDRRQMWASSGPAFTSCGVCGRVFGVEVRMGPPPACCSPACYKAKKRKAKRLTRQKQRARGLYCGNHRERARKYGVPYEVGISRRRVLDAAGWVCAICGELIPDRRWSAYDPDYGTIDHVVPLSLGGGHVSSNVRAAHAHCNVEVWSIQAAA